MTLSIEQNIELVKAGFSGNVNEEDADGVFQHMLDHGMLDPLIDGVASCTWLLLEGHQQVIYDGGRDILFLIECAQDWLAENGHAHILLDAGKTKLVSSDAGKLALLECAIKRKEEKSAKDEEERKRREEQSVKDKKFHNFFSWVLAGLAVVAIASVPFLNQLQSS